MNDALRSAKDYNKIRKSRRIEEGIRKENERALKKKKKETEKKEKKKKKKEKKNRKLKKRKKRKKKGKKKKKIKMKTNLLESNLL